MLDACFFEVRERVENFAAHDGGTNPGTGSGGSAIRTGKQRPRETRSGYSIPSKSSTTLTAVSPISPDSRLNRAGVLEEAVGCRRGAKREDS